MLSVVDAMNASKGFVRPMREGEELVKARMIVAIGLKAKDNEVAHVQALVLRTSGLKTKDPAIVELWVDLSREYGERVVKDNEEEFRKHCDCPAGNSEKCKHMIAVMLCLTGVEEEELDDLSCTDIERQWGVLKSSTLKEYEAKPLSELCHVKSQKRMYVNEIPQITKEMEEKWKTKLMNSAPLSELSIFVSGLRLGQGVADGEQQEASLQAEKLLLYEKLLTHRTLPALEELKKMTLCIVQTLSPQLKAFYDKHIAVTLEKSVSFCAVQQGTSEWKKLRKLRLTSSKARAQYTYYVHKTADWDKRYEELYVKEWGGNEDTRRGLEDEVYWREKYEEKNRCQVLQTGQVVRLEVPWLAASLDGTVIDDEGNLVTNLEIKSLREGCRLSKEELLEFQAIPTLDENNNVKERTQHYAQMQLGMLVSGIDTCEYLVWSQVSSDDARIHVPFGESHVLDLCSRLVAVYFEEFLPRIMASYNSTYNVCDDDGDNEDEDN